MLVNEWVEQVCTVLI